MSRIRSIHPGQATDEDFVSCTAYARLLAILIRCEADDHGVFEWKPLQIKMRIFPADNVDVVDLLRELSATRHVHRYEVGASSFGIIRNFRKWQSPRRPSYTFPIPKPGSVPPEFALEGNIDRNGRPLTSTDDDQDDGSSAGDDANVHPSERTTPDNVGNVALSTEQIPDIGRNVLPEGEERSVEGKEERDSGSSASPPNPGEPTPSDRPPQRTRPQDHPDFPAFWAVYPSRGQATNPRKPAAERFAALAKHGTNTAEIIAGAKGYAGYCRRSGKIGTETVKQALTFLNQEVWKQYLGGNAAPADHGELWRTDPDAWRDQREPPPWPDAPPGTHCGTWLKVQSGWVLER